MEGYGAPLLSALRQRIKNHAGRQELFQQLRRRLEQDEERTLHPKAARSCHHRRPHGVEDDHRLPYKRDVDRIVHSKAYARYVDKTQVVYLVHNDHIAHRSLHVQLVSNFARGIAEILRLNVGLVEAIALGHDVGHPPFGHEGEQYLSELSQEHGNGAFSHALHSCRLFEHIEPLNLGEAVYDGFLCHDGGMRQMVLVPHFGKSWQEHCEQRHRRAAQPDCDATPATLEGCLVRLCDTMSYIGRDLEDAISLGIITREQLPKTALGTTNREILTTLACDLIENSFDCDYIALSQELQEALCSLRAFNFAQIYTNPRIKVESVKIKRSYRILFEFLYADLVNKGTDSHIGQEFLPSRPPVYCASTSAIQIVIDYIAGMTDSFFVKTVHKLFVPSPIDWP